MDTTFFALGLKQLEPAKSANSRKSAKSAKKRKHKDIEELDVFDPQKSKDFVVLYVASSKEPGVYDPLSQKEDLQVLLKALQIYYERSKKAYDDFILAFPDVDPEAEIKLLKRDDIEKYLASIDLNSELPAERCDGFLALTFEPPDNLFVTAKNLVNGVIERGMHKLEPIDCIERFKPLVTFLIKLLYALDEVKCESEILRDLETKILEVSSVFYCMDKLFDTNPECGEAGAELLTLKDDPEEEEAE